MADIIVVGPVTLNSGDLERTKNGAAAISIGESVSEDANGDWVLAQSDGTAIQSGTTNLGIAMSAITSAGQPLAVAVTGAKVDLGTAILTVGEFYVASPNASAGGIAPITDLGVGDFPGVIGWAQTTQILVISKYTTGIAKA